MNFYFDKFFVKEILTILGEETKGRWSTMTLNKFFIRIYLLDKNFIVKGVVDIKILNLSL